MAPPLATQPDRTIQGKVRCPACRAVQEWSAECRRCKCDLGLLWEAAATWQSERTACLRELQAGRPFRALAHARACRRIAPDADSARLLALASLLAGDYPSALHWARAAGE